MTDSGLPPPVPPVEEPVVDLSRLTFDQTLGVLLAGRVVKPGTGELFSLPEGARKALAYYADSQRRRLWDTDKPGNATEGEIKGLLDALDGSVPAGADLDLPASETRPIWRLVSATIRQFGGLHAHCGPAGEAPPELPLPGDAPIVLFIGQNGAGKSQIARALSWGLTGQVPRAHGEPVGFDTLVNHYRPADDDSAAGLPLPTIVPFPGKEHLDARNGQPLIATAVDMVFADEAGQRMTLRRALVRTAPPSRSAVSFSSTVSVVDDSPRPMPSIAAALGVSSLSLEASVLTMARLPFIALDGPNALTKGIAELTGIAPLKKLGERIRGKVRRWLKNDYPEKQRNEFARMEPRFREAALTLGSALDGVRPPLDANLPAMPQERDGGAAYDCALVALDAALTEREDQARRVMMEATGLSLEPGAIDALLSDTRRALAQCGAEAVADRIDTVLAPWYAIGSAEAKQALALAGEIVADAHAFARIDADRQTAARLRLYAALNAWAKGNRPAEGWPPESCPVCETPLDGLTDGNLGTEIRAAMGAVDRQEAASHTDATAWDRAACRRLDSGLPDGVKRLIGADAIDLLTALRKAAADDLIRAAGLTAGPLAGLGAALRDAVTAWADALVLPDPLPLPDLPDHPVMEQGECVRRLRALATVLAHAQWVGVADAMVRDLARLLEPLPEQDGAMFNLSRRLSHVERVLDTYRPLKTARDTAGVLKGLKSTWDEYYREILRSQAAEDSVAPLEELIGLVDTQVGALMDNLRERTNTLCATFYQRTNTASPDLDRVDVVNQTLRRQARFGGMVGDGGDVVNASLGRAWLFAFAVALLERIRARDGGLSLLLLDDPQSLFDQANQRTLATGLGQLWARKTEPLIVTFNHHFAASVVRNAPSGKTRSYEIVPRSSQGLRADVRPMRTELERAREHWGQNDQHTASITSFCGEARRYLEDALCDLIWTSRIAVNGTEGLGFFHAKLSSLTSRGAPYDKDCFRSLAKHEAWDSQTVKEAIHWSHHHVCSELKPHHAMELSKHLDALISVIEHCQQALDRMTATGHVPPRDMDIAGVPALPFSPVKIPVQGAIAARSRASVDDGGGFPPGANVLIDPVCHALLSVGSAQTWLGPVCGAGDVLVVEREPSTDERLSVLMKEGQGFAGWVRRFSHTRILVGYHEQDFAMEYDPSQHSLHPVAGILFRADAAPHRGVSVACGDVVALTRITAALPVEGTSAEPLVATGGKALIGAALTGWPADGSVVAVRVSGPELAGSEQVLKRLGRRLDGAGHVRMLGSLGPHGDSLVARLPTGKADGFAAVPVVEEICSVVGVWFGE